MKNLLPEKEKYYKIFAENVYNEFRKLNYGIQSCKISFTSLSLSKMRKDIINYQSINNGEIFTQIDN